MRHAPRSLFITTLLAGLALPTLMGQDHAAAWFWPQPTPTPAPTAPPTEAERFAAFASGIPVTGDMPTTVSRVANKFLGRPYLAGSLEAGGTDTQSATTPEAEPLVCRLDAFDCVTLVESSLAVARCVSGKRPTFQAFQQELETLRYRDGKRGGYASRLHYFSDWIADNARRGNVLDLTPSLGGVVDRRPLRFMSAHRSSYKALADDAVFNSILTTEKKVSARPRTVIPKAHIARILPLLQSGDVLAFATDIAGLDVVHTALVQRVPNGTVHILHAPEPGKTVTISASPLVDYTLGIKQHVGIMVARPLAPQAGS